MASKPDIRRDLPYDNKPYETLLTQARVKQLLTYNAETGEFEPKATDVTMHCRLATRGRWVLEVDGLIIPMETLAVLYVTGKYVDRIEFKDENPRNYAFDNLLWGGRKRELTSKHPGICYARKRGSHKRWEAQAHSRIIGYFATEAEAVQAREAVLTGKTAVPAPAKRVPTSNYTGVSWFEARKKWRAQITVKGKSKHLGLFETEPEAFDAYKTYKEKQDEI
jgi:hypothetical protein